MADLPRGPAVDAWPRSLPARTPLTGVHVALEPLHRRHAAELFEAAAGFESSFTYLEYGPFPSRDAMAHFIADTAAKHDPLTWAIRPVATGTASGWISLLNIDPANAAIELGDIWFSPRLQRTRAATEAVYLLLKRAADELGYRRMVWRCDALNEAAINSALRLGFTREGTLRADRVIKNHQQNTAMFSIVAEDWPARRDAIAAWLSSDNFAADGTAKQSLAALRG